MLLLKHAPGCAPHKVRMLLRDLRLSFSLKLLVCARLNKRSVLRVSGGTRIDPGVSMSTVIRCIQEHQSTAIGVVIMSEK